MDRLAIAALIRSEIPKLLMIDHAEVPSEARKVAAMKALELGLNGRDARRSTGFNAYLVMENRLKELCEIGGGVVIADRMFPGTELSLHQPLFKYGRIHLGRATIHEIRGLPSANVTRRNGARLNACVERTGDLFNQETDPNAIVHVLLLTLPDYYELSKISATYIAVIAPSFDSFLFIEEIDDFIAGYEEGNTSNEWDKADETDLGLQPRKGKSPYLGEEHRSDDDSDEMS